MVHKTRVAPVRERGLKWMMVYLGILSVVVAPVRERGLKLSKPKMLFISVMVAPVRERGLKCRYLDYHDNSKMSLP